MLSPSPVLTALRLLRRRTRRRPLLPALAVAVLALGSGSSTAVMGVAYAALWRPLPYPVPDELVVVTSGFPGVGLRAMGLSGPEATELGQLTTAFAALGFGYADQAAVTIGDRAISARVARVSAGLLRALAPAPPAGRLYDDRDDRPGGPCLVDVSDAFWRNTLGADPAAVGRGLVVDGRSCQIVGLLPPHVDFVGNRADMWMPLQYDVMSPSSNRANHYLTVVGRRRKEISPAALRADVDGAVARWGDATGQFHVPQAQVHPLAMTPLAERLRGPVRQATLVLLAAVGLVLLIAASNAATLLVANADSRHTEMAVRAALGAGRWRLFRMLLFEAAVVGLLSMVGGIALAGALGHVMARLSPPRLGMLGLILPVWQAACVTGLVTVCAVAACALAVFDRLRPSSLHTRLSAENRSGTASADRQAVRRVLVSVEVALALALFSGAALMVESFWKLSHVDLGFDPRGVVHASVTLPGTRYGGREVIDAFYAQVVDRLGGIPGVGAVGVVSGLPPQRPANNTSFLFEGQSSDPHSGVPPVQYLQFASAGALRALGVRLVAGRLFTDADRRTSQPVALLNDTAARVYFAGASAIGRRLKPFGHGEWMTVVGVIADIRQNGLTLPPGTEVFVPVQQSDNAMGASMTRDLEVLIRVDRGLSVATAMRDAVRRTDAGAAVNEIATMDSVVGDSIGATRFLTSVLASFAVVALLLSASGVYGIVMHTVQARTREIGVRRSLGASDRAVTRLVARQALPVIAAGLAAGGIGTLAGGRALAPFLYAVDAHNVIRLGGVALVLLLTAATACAVPLVRALRIDPATALRD